MAKFTGWKKRYSYLNDYKKGMDGKYVYYGRHYIFQGTDRERLLYKWILGITDILLTALFVIGGLMDGGAIWNVWYVIVPFALEALTIFLLIWKTMSLILERIPVKEYICKKTVPWFKPLACIQMLLCAVSLIAALICLLTHPETARTTGCILYMAAQLLSGAAAFIFLKFVRKYEWIPDPSEEMEQER